MTESTLSALVICALFNFKFVLDTCYQFVSQEDILIFRWWLTFIKSVQIPGYCHRQLACSYMGRANGCFSLDVQLLFSQRPYPVPEQSNPHSPILRP